MTMEDSVMLEDEHRGDHMMSDEEVIAEEAEEEDLDRHANEAVNLVPRPINRLDQHVVNQIAAGEVIMYPANALKELIENALDAGATMIKITLNEGGLKSLQIQDNGSGIGVEDLPLLCERFATSKLKDFSDLSRMSTFGFRGEALASITYITASFTVTTRTKESGHAYKALYRNGTLVPPKSGQSSEPKPCAGTIGTILTAEDMFYNNPMRRKSMSSPRAEYNRALDIVGKYAIHYGGRGVGFMCKQTSSNMMDLNTPSNPATTTHDTIRHLHGSTIARELVRLKPHTNSKFSFGVEGWISGANWSAKRSTFLCFINNRLVDCGALKRAFEALYSTLLPKGGHPWIYVSLNIKPEKVDVNVHPTKREVHFLDEDEIIEAICMHAQQCLVGANSSRTYQFTQAVLPGATDPRKSRYNDDGDNVSKTRGTQSISSQKGYPKHLVRVDARTRTLDSMLSKHDGSTQPMGVSATALGKRRAVDEEDAAQQPTDHGGSTRRAREETRDSDKKIAESHCLLDSIRELRGDISKRRHGEMTSIVQNHVFVGIVDPNLSLSLIQHEKKLYLVNHASLIEEFAYQLVIKQFGAFTRIHLDPPPLLSELIALGIDMEPTKDPSGRSSEEIVQLIAKTLTDRAAMLDEYFSLRIDADKGTLETIPSLLPHYAAMPPERLPTFLLRLGPHVDWRDEKRCFATFARELAAAHVPSSSGLSVPDVRQKAQSGDELPSEVQERLANERWEIQHVWFAAMSSRRGGFVPPKSLLDRNVVQVANLPELYRVFERC